MKLFALLLAVAFAVAGCAQHPAKVAPSTAGVRASVSQARTAAVDAGRHVATAQTSLHAATMHVATLVNVAPAELRPAVVEIGHELDQVRVELNGTQGRVIAVTTRLDESDARAATLQSEIDRQTEQLAAMTENFRVAKAEAKTQTGLAWKWRLIALGEILAVAAFFTARQYFPFLKLI